MPATIRQVGTDRPDLYAFAVTGRIGKDDIEAMARTMKAAFERHGTVDMLVLVEDWDGIALDAALDGEALATQAASARHVRRYAVVGAPGWAEAMINLMSPLSPVEARTFDAADEAAARAWLDDRPA
jgi:hypothetical protein